MQDTVDTQKVNIEHTEDILMFTKDILDTSIVIEDIEIGV